LKVPQIMILVFKNQFKILDIRDEYSFAVLKIKQILKYRNIEILKYWNFVENGKVDGGNVMVMDQQTKCHSEEVIEVDPCEHRSFQFQRFIHIKIKIIYRKSKNRE
jgi:rhodanese-related sulfurtransferase